MRYAVVNLETTEVINIIIFNGGNWSPPQGYIAVQSESAQIGDTFDVIHKKFIKGA